MKKIAHRVDPLRRQSGLRFYRRPTAMGCRTSILKSLLVWAIDFLVGVAPRKSSAVFSSLTEELRYADER